MKVVVGRKIGDPALWQANEVSSLFSPITQFVVLWAVNIFAFLLIARVLPKVFGVIFKFFPPVAVRTKQPINTSVFVVCNFVLSVPSRALLRSVSKLVGLSAEILPIVSVDTALSLVVSFLVRAPNCLEVKAIEISVPVKTLNQVN